MEYLKMVNDSSSKSSDDGSWFGPSTFKELLPTNVRQFDRKYSKKRNVSPERDLNGVKSPKRKKVESLREDECENILNEEILVLPSQPCQQTLQTQPTTSYTTNRYPTNNYYAIDPSQMYGTINHLGAPVNSGMDMASTSTGMNPYIYMVPPDPSMYGMMAPMPDFYLMNGTLPTVPQKTIKGFSSCTLYPPPLSAPPPSRRKRPDGCKTIFVGGLPEMITEDIVKEAFSECGEIATVRMSTKNFCHIKFTSEHHVDQAMFFSGYRIKIENKDEPAYSGSLYVNYVVDRDDQYEYECLIRTLSREARRATLDDPSRPPSQPSIVNYSKEEAAGVIEQLRDEDTYRQACQVLITWLKRGDCNKKNAGTFYSMVQSTHSHVRRLDAEKTKIKEDKLQVVKNELTQKCISDGVQFNDIEKVFKCASMQIVWDHFTKLQRKHIDTWKNNAAETKKANLEDLLEGRVEDEMELCDNENSEKSEIEEKLSILAEEKSKLQEENELIRSQLQVATNQSCLIKDEGDKKNAALLKAYQLMLRNYLQTKWKLEDTLKEILTLESKENAPSDKNQMAIACNGNCHLASGVVGESETRLATLIAILLNGHAFGVNILYISSYLRKMDKSVNTRDVETLMKKFKIVFKEKSTGIGATLKKTWTFLGLKNLA